MVTFQQEMLFSKSGSIGQKIVFTLSVKCWIRWECVGHLTSLLWFIYENKKEKIRFLWLKQFVYDCKTHSAWWYKGFCLLGHLRKLRECLCWAHDFFWWRVTLRLVTVNHGCYCTASNCEQKFYDHGSIPACCQSMNRQNRYFVYFIFDRRYFWTFVGVVIIFMFITTRCHMGGVDVELHVF